MTSLDDDHFTRHDIRLEELLEEDAKPFLPTWGYIVVFTIPAILSFVLLTEVAGFDLVFSSVIALAVMNGSINSIIAILTIRLDGHSQEALDHLDAIMSEMEKFEDTLEQASTMVSSFTGDLEEAKNMFTKIGVDLTELDLEPIADVVERLKENKEGISEVLDNFREMDVSAHIKQAKGIDWKALLDAAEEVMDFIKSKQNLSEIKTIKAPTLPGFSPQEDEFWEDDEILDEEEEFEFVAPQTLDLAPPRRKKRLDLTPPRRR